MMTAQEVLNRNMHHAQMNGYFLDLSEWTVEKIVADLRHCCTDYEQISEEDLTPMVKAWYDARVFGDSQAGKAADC